MRAHTRPHSLKPTSQGPFQLETAQEKQQTLSANNLAQSKVLLRTFEDHGLWRRDAGEWQHVLPQSQWWLVHTCCFHLPLTRPCVGKVPTSADSARLNHSLGERK